MCKIFKKILIPIDGSEGSNAAIDKSIELLATVKPEKLVLLHVGKFPNQLRTYSGKLGSAYYKIIENLKEFGEEALAEAAKRYQEKGITVPVETKFVWGDPPYDIVEEAKKEAYDLIIIGNRGLDGVMNLLMGSVSNYVTRHAHCTVMVARDN